MNLKLLSSLLVSIILITNIVLAAPGWPSAFYGSVTWNGSPAPDGTAVSARINGVDVATTTTKAGKYGMGNAFYVADPYNNICTGGCPEISFFVSGVDTGKSIYFLAGYDTLVDLSASGGQTSTPSSSGGGGGGGGGGGFTPPSNTGTTGNQSSQTQTPVEQPCYPRWNCAVWSACVGGVQTRTCVDEKNCGVLNGQPMLSQPCSVAEGNQTGQAPLALPTGFFLGFSAFEWVIGIIAGIIVAIVIILLTNKKSLKKK